MQNARSQLELTAKQKTVLEYFLRNENQLAYPAKIEKDLKKGISRNWAGKVCEKLTSAGILEFKKERPPRQKNKTEWYQLAQDVNSFIEVARVCLRTKEGRRIFMRSTYASNMINMKLMCYIQERLGTHYDDGDLRRLLTFMRIFPSALWYALYVEGVQSQRESKRYIEEKSKLDREGVHYPFIDDFYVSVCNASALRDLQLAILVGMCTDLKDGMINVGEISEKLPMKVTLKMQTEMTFGDSTPPHMLDYEGEHDIRILPPEQEHSSQHTNGASPRS